MSDAKGFFAYAWEREMTRVRRLRARDRNGPWTQDPVLQTYRFCNVRREHDRTTEWFREHIREPLRASPNVLWATVVFRWFNRIETGLVLKDSAIGLAQGLFEPSEIDRRLRHAIPDGPWTTGSYMIKTPTGMNKIEGLLWCLGQFHEGEAYPVDYDQPVGWTAMADALLADPGATSLETVHAWLTGFPFMGDFMAYEVVTDLRHTDLLCKAPDIMTWANPGPGAARGLDRIHGRPLGTSNRSKPSDRARLIVEMQELLELSAKPGGWPQDWGPWEMRDVEHTLCEFDKYERARLGEGRPRQLFRKGDAG